MNTLINRSTLTRDFTVVSNEVINDKSLSWKARGILLYLISKPHDWVVSMIDLQNNSPAGREATRSGIKELLDAGYLIRTKTILMDGTWKWTTYVYDTPNNTMDGLPVDGKAVHIQRTESTKGLTRLPLPLEFDLTGRSLYSKWNIFDNPQKKSSSSFPRAKQ